MKNAIILMTALLPTTGHRDLIDFASNLPETKVHVLVNGRTFEPHHSIYRQQALTQFFKKYSNVIVTHSVNDSAPQEPEDMMDGFWDWWKNEINANFPHVENWDYVVASEPYGQNVADVLDAQFITYDVERVMNTARGRTVREDMWQRWDEILETSRHHFQIKATLFGTESVGKTTVSKRVSEILEAQWLHEFARPYLEQVGEEVTLQKMDNIHAGQAALQTMAFKKAKTPAVILDTDLFSTVGYHSIMDTKPPERLVKDAQHLKSDIYFVMPTNDVPFVPDPLRYGGDRRESDVDFWIDILDQNRLNYVMVPLGTVEKKAQFIAQKIKEMFEENTRGLKEFQR